MKKTVLSSALLAALAFAPLASAGGQLDEIDVTNARTLPNGRLLVDIVGIRWDERAIPVGYRINSSQNPVPNPLGEPVLDIAQARAAFQRSFDRWNAIPTSYIEMRVVGEVDNPGTPGFDFINELSFSSDESFGAIAASPSVSLIADTTFVDGQDINGDGIPDVSAAVTRVTEINGRNVWPPGLYKAGTILDNDVFFNTKPDGANFGFRFTVGDAALDTNPDSVDLEVVATHEFGHSHGLSHVVTNNRGPRNPRGAVMFPSINTGDPDSERQQRTLDTDDIITSASIYREGSERRGPAAVQRGDVPFSLVYGKITGKVTDGVSGLPVAGAAVFAEELHGGDRVATTYSGAARVELDAASGGLFLASPADSFPSGDYTLYAPIGAYRVGVEALDGGPVSAGQVSLTATVSGARGQQNFDRSFWNLNSRFRLPAAAGVSFPVIAAPGFDSRGIDHVTQRSTKFGQLAGRISSGFTDLGPGSYYVVGFPVQRLIDTFGRDFAVQSALFETRVVDSSTLPAFNAASIVPGRLAADGSITEIALDRPLLSRRGFVAADNDFSPLYSPTPTLLAKRIVSGFDRGEFDTLFLVLQLPTSGPFPGVNAFPPLVGLSGSNSVGTRSFFSEDGTTFTPIGLGFRFQLAVTPTAAP
jgi:hypothetical protein